MVRVGPHPRLHAVRLAGQYLQMPLSNELRTRFEQIQAEGLKYVDFQADAIAGAAKAGGHPDIGFRYLVLNAAAAALDRDDRERDAAARNREVRVTLFVAGVATLATVLQAVAMVAELVRH